MDVVKAFNNELSGLYEVKPPISKAKMTSITRTAIKAIKFYKHVVQSVEKFILKCKPEYKVPGLYVIDSIVRQSRHQFGPDKDVFAPRFAKNMSNTFSNLFSCPPEEKGKIIRVLNLWQKNQVFNPDVIQPLFDQLADPNNPIHREPSTNNNGVNITDRTPPQPQKSIGSGQGTPSFGKSNLASIDTSIPNWVKVAQTQLDAANKALNELSGHQKGADLLQQLQQLQQLILSQTPQKQERSDQILFDKKLLEFDYGDDEDENTSPHHQLNSSSDNINNILQNPDILKSLTAIQQHMTLAQMKQQQLEEEKMRKLKEMKQQEEEFDKHLAQTVPKLPFAAECDLKQFSDVGGMSGLGRGFGVDGDSEVELIDDDGRDGRNVEVISLVDRSPSSPGGSRRSSRSPSRGHRRRRSRSNSGSRNRPDRRRRHRSRSRSRQRHRDRDRETESAKDKDRRKKGLPPIKKNHLSVCSTTLWIGHLSKLVQQEDLSDTFGGFGDIISINVIPPRGCAFVCMNRRQDAARALIRLTNHKLHGKAITLAWAPGKGVKGRELKDFWEVDLGVSYIPWHMLKPTTNFVELEEGGHLDEDTMPENLKSSILDQIQKNKSVKEKTSEDSDISSISFPNLAAEGMPSPAPMMAAMLPGMNVPPPGMPPVPAPTAHNIDTSQPPPGLPPPPTVPMPPIQPIQPIQPGLPLLAKPGLIMPPFSFATLPPPLGMGVPNILGSLPIGVPPPSLSGLMIPQPLLHPGLMPPIPQASQELIHADAGRQPHPLEGRPLTNSKDDGVMEVDADDNINSSREKRDWGRSLNDERRDNDDKLHRDKERDERKERDRDRRDRGRDKHRDDRDRRDRGRDSRDGRSRNRSRSRDRDSRNRSRDRRIRSPDRERSKGRRDDDRAEGNHNNDKKQLSPWIEVAPNTSAGGASGAPEKPSLQQRLRSIAEGRPGDVKDIAQEERPGPPIVINLNNASGPRPLFGPGSDMSGPRGPPPFTDNLAIRPPFNGPFADIGPGPGGPGMNFDDGPVGPLGPGPGFDDHPPDGPMLYDGEGPMFDGPRGFDPRRGRFDGPLPLMRRPFDEPPNEMMMMGPPGPMFDFPHPGGPRMRFSPRGPMGPIMRGMGPGPPVSLFGPRGPRPLIPRLGPWIENQGSPMNDRPRPLFDDRSGRDRRSSGRRRDRDGPRTSRWSKEEGTENEGQQEMINEFSEMSESTNIDEPVNDVHTPVYDEPQTRTEDQHSHSQETAEQSAEPTIEASGSATPCHDEPSDMPVNEDTGPGEPS